MSNKLAKMSSLQRPNLLINSDFRSGIINQKGIASLDKSNGTTELTVDGWISYGINCSVSSNFITFANRTSTKHTVKQPIEINISTQLTVYINAFNISGNVYIYLNGYEGQRKKINNGDNIFVFNLSSYVSKSFIIEFDPNASLSINRMKMEYGDCFTGMPVWDETLELLKCQRHYMIIKGLKIAVRGHTNQVFTSTFILPIRMKKSPTVTIEDTTNSYGVSNISGWADSNVLQISFKTLSDNMVDCRVNKVVLDAYDY